MVLPTKTYPDAARELIELLTAADWGTLTVTVSATHFDFTETSSGHDFVTVNRFGGVEVRTNDGWSELSGQDIQVMPFSRSRESLAAMIKVIHKTLDGYQGRPRMDGAYIQMCVLDESHDLFDEESSYYGSEMDFLTQVAGYTS